MPEENFKKNGASGRKGCRHEQVQGKTAGFDFQPRLLQTQIGKISFSFYSISSGFITFQCRLC